MNKNIMTGFLSCITFFIGCMHPTSQELIELEVLLQTVRTTGMVPEINADQKMRTVDMSQEDSANFERRQMPLFFPKGNAIKMLLLKGLKLDEANPGANSLEEAKKIIITLRI